MSPATERNNPAPAPAHEGPPLAVWRRGFLVALAETGNASAAARCAGIERSTAYRRRDADPDFAQEWAEAIEVATDALEQEARKLALGEYVTYKFCGKTGAPLYHPVTGAPYTERVISTPMLAMLLKAERPDRFKERSAVETSPAPAARYDLSRLSAEELAALEILTAKATPPALPQ